MSEEKSRMSRQDLRVLKKNMIYCSGLPSSLTEQDLKSDCYFGQYGKIQKMVISPFPNRNYCSIYITFQHQFQAAIAILSCNEFQIDKSILWCLFGTMKYCTFFLKKIQCKNSPNCPYLHALDKKNEIQIKNSPSQAFPLHKRLAEEVARKNPQRLRKLKDRIKPQPKLPSPLHIFQQLPIPSVKQSQKSKKAEEINNIQRKNKPEMSLQTKIRKMLLNQFRRSQGSRLMMTIKEEEKHLKEVIINELKK